MAEFAPSEPDVFLSYAREDEARARELATALGQRGLSVFWDREVPPGQTWHSYIGEALANARCVVVAWSSHSIASPWVLEEASEGKDRNVLVPVLFERVQPPFGFRAIQAANLIDWRPGLSSPAFDSLLGAVQRILGGQAGSGAAAELVAPPQPTPAEPAPKAKPSVQAGPPARSERRAEPMTSQIGQAGAWSRRTLAAMVAGFVALAGAGGIIWRLTQPAPITPEPVAEAEPATPEPESPDPAAETAPAVEPATPPAAPRETAGPRDELHDCLECPEMVLVPAGKFTMGSPPNEAGRDDDEGPQRQVTIAARFWVGRYEVTFAEWDACVAAGGCNHEPSDNGWGRESRPVVNVSWNDAKEYVNWLSQTTSKTFRLLSEAEWEYVARARTETPFSLPAPDGSHDIGGKGLANCAGCGSEWDGTKTAPVGSFKANHFGLYDTAGNVWEWVQDCYHKSYQAAPIDGSAWEDGDDCSRVRRGGSLSNGPRIARSANRVGNNPDYRINNYGFRVARTAD